MGGSIWVSEDITDVFGGRTRDNDLALVPLLHKKRRLLNVGRHGGDCLGCDAAVCGE